MPGLLRVTTAGSVNDGKSTLIGRLLQDAKAIFDDQFAAVSAASRRRGRDEADLALHVDGLREEREQGITIDVAYRYFGTPRRAFVLADTPGHVEYTRNMVTGASTADVAIILADARHGLVEQCRRHAAIAGLLRVRHVVLAVNKMDLVDFAEEAFDRIAGDFDQLARRLGIPSWTAVPISALHGDNVVARSGRTPWYSGQSLLAHLETLEIPAVDDAGTRFVVQLPVRADADGNYQGYAGRVASGTLHAGDTVTVSPGGWTTRVTAINTFDGALEEAPTGRSVVVRLADDREIERGGLLSTGAVPAVSGSLVATACWLTDEPLRPGERYRIRHATGEVAALVDAVESRLDVSTLDSMPTDELGLNDIGTVRLRAAERLVLDRYTESRVTGGFLFVEDSSGAPVGAGLVEHPTRA
jgi:sulfate adenylyltransferase subunit 1